MAENAIISDLEFAPQLTDDMVFAVEDVKNTYSSTLGMLRGQLNKIFVERKDVDFNTLTDDGFYQVSGTLINAPVAGSITWLVQVVKDASTIVQIVFGLDTVNYLRNFARRWNGSTWTSWDVIGGKIIQSLSSSTTDIPSSKAVKDAVNTKQGTITGGATSIVSNNLTVSRALVSDGSGKVAVSAVTSTELGYLDGVTSAIQTQLNGKQAAGSYANTNLSNVASNIDYIVESGGNDSKWYKKYKSGWIHQGGTAVLSSKTPTAISLLKPMANSSYVICIAGYGTSVSDGTGQLIANVTTTSFSFANNATGANSGSSSWLVIGKAQ